MIKAMLIAISGSLVVAAAACGYESSQLQLRMAIDNQQEPFHRCYAQALLNDPDMEGSMRVMIHVPAAPR